MRLSCSVLLLLLSRYTCAAFSEFSGSLTTHTSVHRISLPKFSNLNTTQTCNILRWKQAALGDGGVYWDQRPKSLNALNMALAEHIFYRLQDNGQSSTNNYFSVECAVISTCARFEIVLSIDSNVYATNAPIVHGKEAILRYVAECLAVQKNQLRGFTFMSKIHRDDPSRIIGSTYSAWVNSTEIRSSSPILSLSWAHRLRRVFTLAFLKERRNNHRRKTLVSSMNELKLILLHEEGVEPVAMHLSRIAAGLDNDLGIFRPFSARDSHVIHQLKRSAAGAVGLMGATIPSNSKECRPLPKSVKYIKLMFDSALQAGKAARSSKVVPLLDALREASRANNIMTTQENKIYLNKLTSEAELQAIQLAVQPTVQNCVSRFSHLKNPRRQDTAKK